MTADSPNRTRRWAILALLGIAQLMVVLDATIVTIALPSAQRALHFTNDNRQWIVTAYALAFGSLLLLGGRLSDLFGRKWTFIAGLSGFAIASAVGGAAQSFGMLAAARTFQGAFGALLAPSALSLLTTTFTEPSERAKAFGVFSAIAGSGASIGLLLGGILTQSLNWRYSMYVNLVVRVHHGRGRADPPAQLAPADAAATRHPRHSRRLLRPVCARVRLLARADHELGQPPHDRDAGHRRAAACSVRRTRGENQEPAVAAPRARGP